MEEFYADTYRAGEGAVETAGAAAAAAAAARTGQSQNPAEGEEGDGACSGGSGKGKKKKETAEGDKAAAICYEPKWETRQRALSKLDLDNRALLDLLYK